MTEASEFYAGWDGEFRLMSRGLRALLDAGAEPGFFRLEGPDGRKFSGHSFKEESYRCRDQLFGPVAKSKGRMEAYTDLKKDEYTAMCLGLWGQLDGGDEVVFSRIVSGPGPDECCARYVCFEYRPEGLARKLVAYGSRFSRGPDQRVFVPCDMHLEVTGNP